MDNSRSTGCWPKSLWCLTTCCGSRINKVAPQDPFPVVSIEGRKDPTVLNQLQTSSAPPVRPPRKRHSNGHVNHFFVPDENDDATHNNSDISEAPAPSPSDIPLESLDFQLRNSIFIEIDKERRIRVVNLQTPEDTQVQNSSKHLSGGETSNAHANVSPRKSGVEEEDEYWFSKWARKPRFKSIFEKNTIHRNVEDGEKENNNSVDSTTLSKDFELARAAAAAKRRAWAYNNGVSGDSVVEQSAVVDNDDEEFNSIDICDLSTRWSKHGGGTASNTIPSSDTEGNVTLSPSSKNVEFPTPKSLKAVEGVTNMGFEDDENSMDKEEEDPPAELLVESIQVAIPSPSPSMSKNDDNIDNPVDIETAGTIEDSHNISQSLDEINNDESERKKSPLLFFVHGISTCSEIWKSQMEHFHNRGFEVVAPDLLGHGFSTTPNNTKYYHFESLAQDLLNVYDYFVEDDRKVILIGHGYGACLASVIARVRPKSSRLLISISGGGPTPLINRSCCRGSLIPFYCKLFHKEKKKGRFDNPELRHVLPPAIRDYMLNGQIWNDGDSAFYRRITVPTLLVYGMKDKVVNLVEECEMERTIPKSFLEIIDSAGHMVMIDEPVKLNKMLEKFIQSWV